MSSELKANKVSPATGTALQIGDSGDTISAPSGATVNLSSATVTLPVASVTTHVTQTDTSVIENNIALLAFQVAANASLSKFGMVDSAVDTFTDTSGIDTGNSTNATPIEGAVGGGALLANTTVLIHPTGSNSATSWTTDDPTGHTMTASGGAVEISTSHVKFAPNSIVFSGNASQKATIPHHNDFVLGSGDFTIDFWMRPHNMSSGFGGGSSNVLLSHGTSNAAANFNWYFAWYTGTQFKFAHSDGSTITSVLSGGTTTPTNNTYQHIAVVRNGSDMKFYKDGVQIGSTQTVSFTTAGTSQPLALFDDAMDWDTNFVGYIDEIRISKAARWTSAFTPETEEYAATAPADYTIVSNTHTAEDTATTVDLVFLLETVGTVTLGTDIKAYVSRNGNANYSAALTLVDEGDWGTNKKIITARGVDLSSLAGTTSMRYKITSHNQSESKQCKIHGVSLAWS